MNVPDTAGFADAQSRLVQGLGHDVTFNFKPTLTYPSGVYLDPETNEPLDPTITFTASSASASVDVKATVIRRTPQLTKDGTSDGEQTVGGIVPKGKCWLRIPSGYDPTILGATTFVVFDTEFEIQRFVEDGIGGQTDRLYVEGALISDPLTPSS